jgi:predicted metal-dependent phosphoesterase TrpH
MSADLHCHTRLSDGSMGIEELVILAKINGVNTISVTDHDCTAGSVRAAVIGKKYGVTVLPGTELSAFDYKRGRKVHLLAYLFDSPARLEGLCARTSKSRKDAGIRMVQKVTSLYPISSKHVMKFVTGSTNIYKQHIMNALVDAGFSQTIYGDVYNKLFAENSPDCINVSPVYPDVFDVMREIHEAGGLSVLAHPGQYDSFDLIPELMDAGLTGIEVFHSNNTKDQQIALLDICRTNALVATGGSDFHGMYSKEPCLIGCHKTPKDQLDALLGFKGKKTKK